MSLKKGIDYIEKTCNDLTDLKKFTMNKEWVYRGQKNINGWGLKTAIERAYKEGDQRRKIECGLLEKFRREYHNFADRIPEEEDLVEWFSLMQHYGVPTRLLDWTYSVYVAAFFALEDFEDDEDGAIWAVDYNWLEEILPDELKAIISSGDIHLRKIENFNKFNNKSLIVRGNPYYLHQRLKVQQGCFLVPGDVTKTFEDNLSEFAGNIKLKDYLIKFIIPKKSRVKILRELISMNISRFSLFPGLDGFSASLKSFAFVRPEIIVSGIRCKGRGECNEGSIKKNCVFSTDK